MEESTKNGFHLLRVTSEERKAIFVNSQVSRLEGQECGLIATHSREDNKLHRDSQGANLQLQTREAIQALVTTNKTFRTMLNRENLLYPLITPEIVKINNLQHQQAKDRVDHRTDTIEEDSPREGNLQEVADQITIDEVGVVLV